MALERPLTNEEAKVDVIIVGAGVSGLTTAVKILEKDSGLQIKILDASSMVGGQIAETLIGEIGAKWMTEEHCHLHNWLRNLSITPTRRVISSRKLKRCWDIDRGIWAPFVKFELERYLYELELRVYKFKPGRRRLKKYATMEEHICKRLFFSKSRQFMLNLVRRISGVAASEIDFAEFMRICYSCGGLSVLIDLYFEWPATLMEVSSAELLSTYMEQLRHTNILLSRNVHKILHYKDYVEVYDSESQVHIADVVVLALPWNNIQEIYFQPPIPSELRRQRIGYAPNPFMISSFVASYNDAHWRNACYSGSFLLSQPFLIVGHEYKLNTYSCVMMHDSGIEPLVKSIALHALSQYFGDEMLMPNQYFQRTIQMNSLVNTPFTTPWNRVIWSSSAAAATVHRGCMSGAIQSGLRAATNTLLLLRPQIVSWQDIAEIQKQRIRLKREVSWVEMVLSTWNLYNVSYYGIFVFGLVYFLRQMNGKYGTISN